MAFGRLLVDDLRSIDFADLLGHGWNDLEVCGYSAAFVTRTDGLDLSNAEQTQLEQAITDDLRYDYSEEELDISFDAFCVRGALMVFVQERFDNDSSEADESLSL